MRLLTLSLICQLGFFCAPGQAQVAKAGANPEPSVGVEGNNSESAGMSTITESILIRIDERIVKQMDYAWRIVGAGFDNKETVLLLFRLPDGSIEARSMGLTDQQKAFSFKWHPSAIAILHTHPNAVNPQPSPPDRQLADKLSVPIFTLTVRGMYLYDPHTKKVTQIKRGLDWLELSKWKLTSKLASRTGVEPVSPP